MMIGHGHDHLALIIKVLDNNMHLKRFSHYDLFGKSSGLFSNECYRLTIFPQFIFKNNGLKGCVKRGKHVEKI